jgi:RNA polymerase primary sigma factor
MGKYRLDSIARLARQLCFAPIARRLQQLHATEDLLLQLKPDQAYELSAITFAITGYEPRGTDGAMLTGIALQHDLGMLAEQVSESLQLDIKAVPELVLTIEDVVQRMGVTSKTVQRWRRRGLPAGRYTFGDGKRRIGFRLSHVRRFAQGSPAEDRPAAAAASHPRSVQWLLAQAAKLAERGYWRMLVAERLARPTGIAAPALDRLLSDHAAQIEFAASSDPQLRRLAAELLDSGQTLSAVASTTGLPKYEIYRILLDRRLDRAIRKKIPFIDDSIYHQPDATQVIDQIIAQEPVTALAPSELDRIPRELPPYLRDLYRIPLLCPARERGLFLKYQYLRFCAAEMQRALDPQTSTNRDLRRLKTFQAQARIVRAQIVEANLRLVVSVARKHVRDTLQLMDLVSEGNLILIRAAGSFDVHRGTRFSTYAVYALMRGFARYVPAALRQLSDVADPALLDELRDPASAAHQDRAALRDEVDRLIAQLDEPERRVITQRYGLEQSRSPLTCQELGALMQVSRQRITQIEQSAMAKLREIAR